MRRALAWVAFGLATLVAGYWTYVNGFQVITTLTFATRMDAPAGLWALTALYGAHVVAACVAWFLGLSAMNAGRFGRGVAYALGSSLISWPWLPLLYAKFSGG